ncbi:hypothetical protein KI440_03320 [Candidatus Saccharibacteria bacterium TM7i]|nr:hypothetical protein KI440_03320 [Candidatus Saccharibacteria bacterium TM7i]
MSETLSLTPENPNDTPDTPVSLEYAFNTDGERHVEFSYPEANLESVQATIAEHGLDSHVAVREVAGILERHSLDGVAFNRLADRHGGVERYKFNEYDAILQYTHDTSRLIAEIEDEGYEAMIYLDKSARPPEALVGALWDQYADEDAERPTSDFLNIDRVQILNRHGYPVTKKTPNEKIKEYTFELLTQQNKDLLREDAARIRALFVDGAVDPDNVLSAFDQPSRLDEKSICIVDEVKSSGSTIRISTALLKLAFPESEIHSTYFWSGPDKSVPIWYEEGFATGRGVGDPDPAYYYMMHEKERSSDSLKRVIGSFALSAPHYHLDDDGEIVYYKDQAWELLKEDIETLANCELFGYVSLEDGWDRGLARNAELFYKKLDAIGYDGPPFSPDAIAAGLFYGTREHPGEGYLTTRRQREQ